MRHAMRQPYHHSNTEFSSGAINDRLQGSIAKLSRGVPSFPFLGHIGETLRFFGCEVSRFIPIFGNVVEF